MRVSRVQNVASLVLMMGRRGNAALPVVPSRATGRISVFAHLFGNAQSDALRSIQDSSRWTLAKRFDRLTRIFL